MISDNEEHHEEKCGAVSGEGVMEGAVLARVVWERSSEGVMVEGSPAMIWGRETGSPASCGAW